MPCPGMSTQESRGRLTTCALAWLAGMCTSISVSELALIVSPTCSLTSCRLVSPPRVSTPATRMLTGPLNGVPEVPAFTRPRLALT